MPPKPVKLTFSGNNCDVFACLDCGKQTTRQEAELRNFSRGRCAFCCGQIAPQANIALADKQLISARRGYRKLVGRGPDGVARLRVLA